MLCIRSTAEKYFAASPAHNFPSHREYHCTCYDDSDPTLPDHTIILTTIDVEIDALFAQELEKKALQLAALLLPQRQAGTYRYRETRVLDIWHPLSSWQRMVLQSDD